MIAQNCFLYCLLPKAVASAVGLQTDEIETKFLHANSILEFSHSLDPKRTLATLNYRIAVGSLDHLVGGGDYRRRNCNAECLRCFQIDDKLKFCRRLSGQVRRCRTLQDTVDVACRAALQVVEVHSV